MQSPHDGLPWTSQHTRALFRLFTTSAPPDFQRQILERVAQRQHAPVQQRMRWYSPGAWGLGWYAWDVGIPQPHCGWRHHVIATVGGCGLVLGASLAWWVVLMDPYAPTTPAVLVSRIASSPPSDSGEPTEGAIRSNHRAWFGRANPQEAVVRVAEFVEPIDTASQVQPGTTWDRGMASQAREESERTLLVPAPASRLTAQKARHSPTHKQTYRSGRPRSAPGKATRPHTKPATGQQVPGLPAESAQRRG